MNIDKYRLAAIINKGKGTFCVIICNYEHLTMWYMRGRECTQKKIYRPEVSVIRVSLG